MRDTTIRNISVDELKRLATSEGLILQGCGGDPQEWLDGINEILTDEQILLDGSKFADISVFGHNGSTNILFGMDDVNIDVGKLAIWRLQSHSTFGGTWLSDYRVNQLGVTAEPSAPERSKPEAELIGADGNIFNLIGIAARALKNAGLRDEAKEMSERDTGSSSYDNALAIITEYVEPTEVGGMELGM
jgi:hypothetical protein